MEISATIDVKSVSKRMKNFERRKLPNLVQKSLNKAIVGMKTDASQGKNGVLKKRINMKTGDIKKRIHITKAQKGNGKAIFRIIEKKPPNLITYGAKARPKAISGKKRLAGAGVAVRAWEAKKLYRGTFVAPVGVGGGSSRDIVVARSGKGKTVPSKGSYAGRKIRRGPRKGQAIKREPLKAIFGPSLQRVFTRKPKAGGRPRTIIAKLGHARFTKELNRLFKVIRKL